MNEFRFVYHGDLGSSESKGERGSQQVTWRRNADTTAVPAGPLALT